MPIQVGDTVVEFRVSAEGRAYKLGKCENCRVVWQWKGKPLHRDAHCPVCHAKVCLTTWRIRSIPFAAPLPGRCFTRSA